MVELESFNRNSTPLRMRNNQKSVTCIEQIEFAREKTLKTVNEMYDKFVAKVNERKIKIETKLNDGTEKIKEKLQMEESNSDAASKLQKGKNIKREITNLMSIFNFYKYFEFRAGDVSDIDFRSICGSLIETDFLPNGNPQDTPTTDDKDVDTTRSPPAKRRRKETTLGGKNGSKLKIAGIKIC